MRKTVVYFVAVMALTAGLWASVQPVCVPCPEMKKAAGAAVPGPCPMKDCCRIAPPAPQLAAVVAAPARIKPAVVFLPPINLHAPAALTPVQLVHSLSFELIRTPDLPPPPRMLPLRI